AMLVWAPFGELRQIFDHRVAVRVEDVRPVFVIEDAGLVGLIIGVAPDMRPAVDQQHPGTVLARQPLRKDGAGKAGPDDQIIVTALIRAQGRRHSAATSSAGLVAPLRVPSRSWIKPAMRPWVVSQLVAESMRSASASHPLSGRCDSSSAASQAATNSSAVEAIFTPSS